MPYVPDSRLGRGNHRPIDCHSPRATLHEYWPSPRGQASLDFVRGAPPLQGVWPLAALGVLREGSFAEHPEAKPRDMPPTAPLAPRFARGASRRGAKGGELVVACRWVMGVPRE